MNNNEVPLFDNCNWIGLETNLPNEQPYSKRTVVAARYLRREFVLDSQPLNAKVSFCGLGLSELYINGHKIGNEVLSPPLSTYNKTAFYVSYDITEYLRKGTNAIGVILGNGRFMPPFIGTHAPMPHYGFPKMVFKCDIELENKSILQIISDENWKITANGPIRDNNEYHGEHYDARMEMADWSKSGFDDKDWFKVDLCKSPTKQLKLQNIPPIKVMKTFKPKKVTEPEDNVYIVDFGQNISGWVQLKVDGKKGQTIRLRFAEILKSDGNIDRSNLSEAEATDEYIMKGENEETWEPRFTIHGFRFVEITGFPDKPTENNIIAKLVYNNLETIGQFDCSNEIVNKIYLACFYTIAGNYRSIPTDDASRSERQGYLGDRSIVATSESFIFNNEDFYEKWLDDIADSQRNDGSIPQNCPAYWEYFADDVTWPSAYFTVADMLYNQFGNQRVIKNHYSNMKKWWQYMVDNYEENETMPRDFLGDWVVPPFEINLIHTKDQFRITDGKLIGTAFFYHITCLMLKFSEILNQEKDNLFFSEKIKNQKLQFHNIFWDNNTKSYTCNTPTANILALHFDLVPDQKIETVKQNLREQIAVIFNDHLPVGMIGLKFLMRVLTNHGMEDLAWKILTNKTYPGWGYMIENEATTIWELWNCNTAIGEMRSMNQPMNIGDLIIWLYENIAGIKNVPGSIGHKQLEMRPLLMENLEFANTSYQTPNGEVKSCWKHLNNKFTWEISIPRNSKAIVYVPTSSEIIFVNEKVRTTKLANDTKYACIELKTGTYIIKSDYLRETSEKSKKLSMPVFSEKSQASDTAFFLEMNPNEKDAHIRFTTNGSEPTEKSLIYTSPLEINNYCFVRAASFNSMDEKSFATQAIFDVYDETQNGLNYAYYEGENWQMLPDFDELVPKKHGICRNLDVSTINERNDFWGIRFTGLLKIESEGEYEIFVASDDGSRIFLDNQEIINHDGVHPATEKSAKVQLQKGMHNLRIDYFQATLGYGLTLMMKGLGIPKQPIPISLLYLK